MPIFAATFAAVAVTAAQDVFEITAAASTRVALREIRLAQYSDAADAQAEMLSIQIMRGHSASGSGGSSVTPANVNGWTAAPAAASAVEANNTTVASSGSPVTLLADSFNVMGGFRYYPVPDERIIVEAGQRLVVRITAPADSLTMNGTIVFEELGKMPTS